MSNTLVKNISRLYQAGRKSGEVHTPFLKGADLKEIPFIENAWLLIKEDKFHSFGQGDLPEMTANTSVIDAQGRLVLPTWCDSHTHIVFAKPRTREFVDRINGLSYEEIAKRGGGILNSAKHLSELSAEALEQSALERIHEVIKTGTGLLEIKSGYGLSHEMELKMLRVIGALKEKSPIPIKATFLAAHALPQSFKQNKAGFLNGMINKTLPQVAEEGLADYIDIFCEKGFFSAEDVDQLLEAGAKYGLRGKIHTNQFNHIGGIEAAIRNNALSVDHLEVINEEEMELLKKSNVIPTLLPSAPFFLNDDHFPPMKKMIDGGIGFALATDYNPGSTPSGNMPFLLSLACIKGRISPEAAVNAATYNGAWALEEVGNYGSIDVGKKASFIITNPMADLNEIPYFFGKNPVWKVFLDGQPYSEA